MRQTRTAHRPSDGLLPERPSGTSDAMTRFLVGIAVLGVLVLVLTATAWGAAAPTSGSDREDPTELRFRAGMEALGAAHTAADRETRDRRLDEAITAFRAILVNRPELVRVRLELARAFFLKEEDTLAKRHFEQVLAGEPPEAVAANIQRFLNIMRARRRWEARFGLALAPDTNIGAASGGRTIMIDTVFGRLPFTLTDPARKESGVGLSVWTGGEYQHPLSPSWRLRAGGDISRREYRGSDFDRMTLSGYTGPRWLVDARTEASLLLEARKHWSAGKGYHEEIGPRLQAQRRLTRRVTAHGGLSWHGRRHDRHKHLDGPVKGLSAGLSWVLTPTLRADLSAGVGEERAKVRKYRNESRWASAGLSWALGWGFTTGVSASVRRTDYEGGWAPHTSNNAPREDETRSLRLSAHNRGLTLWGFSPRVSVVREQRESNAQLHDYKRTSGELQFVRLF